MIGGRRGGGWEQGGMWSVMRLKEKMVGPSFMRNTKGF